MSEEKFLLNESIDLLYRSLGIIQNYCPADIDEIDSLEKDIDYFLECNFKKIKSTLF